MKGGAPIQSGGPGGRAPAARALCALAGVGFAWLAGAQMPEPPSRGPGARGAVGKVLEYRESPSARILYLEEKGSLLSPLPPPRSEDRRDALPAPDTVKAAQAPAAEPAPKAAPAKAPAKARTAANP